MVELPQHEVHIDEDDGEAQDEVIDISPDCPRGNVTKAVGNIDLGFKKKMTINEEKKKVLPTPQLLDILVPILSPPAVS